MQGEFHRNKNYISFKIFFQIPKPKIQSLFYCLIKYLPHNLYYKCNSYYLFKL
ncbi:hypothetical protein TFUB4_01694 [Tannerella forsythia]|nr:hypothetical protein TFUB4_01694 [Tannerella forsythia]